MQPARLSTPLKPRRSFPAKECAFLRRIEVVSETGEVKEEYHCLFHKDTPCECLASGNQYAFACKDAVKHAFGHFKKEEFFSRLEKKHKLDGEKYDVKGLRRKAKEEDGYWNDKSEKSKYWFCKRKRRYASQKQAEENRRYCEAMRGVPLRVMFCPFCKGWHLTKKHVEREPGYDEMQKQKSMTSRSFRGKSLKAKNQRKIIEEKLIKRGLLNEK